MTAGEHDLGGDREVWDEWYAEDGSDARRWSGRPNDSLVAEVTGLPPSTALDVGCGEGADAIWLAQRGWRVTAIDPSSVALGRAGAAARSEGVDVTWVQAGLLELPDTAARYGLVSWHYGVLPRRDDDAAITALLGAVAPGGSLLAVHHEGFPECTDGPAHGADSADYVSPADVAAHLDDAWEVQVDDTRDRERPAGDHDVRDVVLRARRIR